MVCQKSSNYSDTFSRCFCWTVCTLSSFLTFASIRSSKLWVKMMAAYIQYSKYVPVSFKHDKEVQRKGIKFLRDGGVRIRQNQVQPWEEGRWERDLIKIAEISRSEHDMFLDEVNFQFFPGEVLTGGGLQKQKRASYVQRCPDCQETSEYLVVADWRTLQYSAPLEVRCAYILQTTFYQLSPQISLDCHQLEDPAKSFFQDVQFLLLNIPINQLSTAGRHAASLKFKALRAPQ